MEFLHEYLIEDALIVIPALIIIGKIVKETPKVQSWTIPYVLLGIGVPITIGLLGFSVGSVIQGVLVSGGAVYGHQLLKQFKRKDE